MIGYITMNMVILTESDAVGVNTYRLFDRRAEHIRSVLKLGEGDTLEVGLLDGPQGRALIKSVTGDSVELVCNRLREIPVVRPAIDLICALPRPQTLKKVLLTSAMMGVRSLHLIRANRVEKSYFQSPLIEPENQMPYLIDGLSQGRLTHLPEVHIHDRFRPFFEDRLGSLAGSCGGLILRLLCSDDDANSLSTVFDPHANCVTMAIGPEGGWVPFEIELMQSLGFRPFTLGRWTLRVEHAVTAALSQIELLRIMKNGLS